MDHGLCPADLVRSPETGLWAILNGVLPRNRSTTLAFLFLYDILSGGQVQRITHVLMRFVRDSFP